MKNYSKCVALCALLLGTSNLYGQAVLISPNGDFSSGTPSTGPLQTDDEGIIDDWEPAFTPPEDGGDFRFEYRADAGPNGVGDNCAVIQDFANVGSGVLVANDNIAITLASLGLSSGNVYKFSHDMRADTDNGGGTTLGGFKVDYYNGGAQVGSTGDIFPAAIGNAETWETYEYDIAIPSGVDGIKIVLLWGAGSDILFDNVSVDPTPITVPFAPSSIPNGDFESGGDFWGLNDGDTFNFDFTYPATGGNPGTGGYARIEDVNQVGGFGILVSNSNDIMTLNGLGLTAGETYKFSVDMLIEAGVNIGGLKVDFFNGFDADGSTGDMYEPLIGTGATWETYDFEVSIPSTATAIKVVLLWGPESTVCYDNVTFDPIPLVVAPITDIPNKNFDNGGDEWFSDSGFGTFTFTYPSSGGNPGGHAVINNTGGDTFFGVLVANDNGIIPLSGLGLTPGEGYVFSQDMRIISGSSIGGLKIEFYTGLTEISNTGDMFPTPIAPATSWQTYEFPVAIPAAADGIKVVPLWGSASEVGYDNICFDPNPIVVPPVEFMNPDFEVPDGAGWATAGEPNTFFDFPATGGNPGGYALMDNNGASGSFGVLVSNNGAIIPAADIGITPGTTVTVNMDMLKDSGTDMGTIKIEYYSGTAGGFSSGDESEAPNPLPLAPDGSWATYTFELVIPATIGAGGAVDGVKIVPIAGIGSSICYDNIEIVVPTAGGDLVLTVDSFDTVNNMIMLNLSGVESGETYSIFSSSTLSAGVTSDTGVDVDDATSQPFGVPADEASSPGFFQAKKD